jgi:hypothetical protein
MVLQTSRLRLTQAIYFGEPPTAAGAGTVTSVTDGNGILATPNPIVGAGVLRLTTLTSDWNAGNKKIISRNSIDTVNVQVAGAAGNDIADDTIPIQTALNSLAANGGTVYFPAGTYKTTATITKPVAVSIVGSGENETFIKAYHNNPVITQTTAVFAGDNFSSIADLAIQNDAGHTSSIGIYFKLYTSLVVERVDIQNATIGLELWGVLNSTFNNIVCGNCATGVYIHSTGMSDGANNNYFNHLFCASDTTGLSINAPGSYGNYFVNSTFENSITPLSIAAGNNTTFNQCWFEGNTNNISLTGGDDIKFTNCTNISNQQFINTAGFAATRVVVENLNNNASASVLANAAVTVFRDGNITPLHITQLSSATPPAPAFANAGFFLSNNDNLYGLYGGVEGGGSAFLQVGRNDAATYYNLLLQPEGGNVGISTSASAPTRTLDLRGVERLRGIAAPAVSEGNSATLYFDTATNHARISENGGPYVNILGSGGLTGTGVATKLAYWTSATNVTDEPNITLGGAYTLDVNGDINLSSATSVIRQGGIAVFSADGTMVGTIAIGGNNGATLGIASTAVGVGALSVATGVNNTALGNLAGNLVTTGVNTAAIGDDALGATTTGNDNTALGHLAGVTNTVGSDNVLVGSGADVNANNLTNAVAIGYQAVVADNNAMQLGNAAMRVGIRTAGTPKHALDVGGAVAVRQTGLALVNGPNQDVVITDFSWFRVTGPTAPFSIGGVAGGTGGQVLMLRNTVAFQMTLNNMDAGSLAANQIVTPTGGNINCSVATLVYDDTSDLWVVMNYF